MGDAKVPIAAVIGTPGIPSMSQPGNPRHKFGAVLPTPDEFQTQQSEVQTVPQVSTIPRVNVESDNSDSEDEDLPDFITNRPSLDTFANIFGEGTDSEDDVIDLEKESEKP